MTVLGETGTVVPGQASCPVEAAINMAGNAQPKNASGVVDGDRVVDRVALTVGVTEGVVDVVGVLDTDAVAERVGVIVADGERVYDIEYDNDVDTEALAENDADTDGENVRLDDREGVTENVLESEDVRVCVRLALNETDKVILSEAEKE